MQRSWVERFYGECGREASLAYNVLNQTNTWGVTLCTALLATIFIQAVTVENGDVRFLFPTIYHWAYIAVAWVILLRFFARSALGLVNLYRWNALMGAASNVLSIPEENPAYPVYVRNFARKVESYLHHWRSPISMWKLLRENLRLMYLWVLLGVLSLFIWGAVVVEKDFYYFIGLAVFAIPTFFEAKWFLGYRAFRRERPVLEEEPDIQRIWQEATVRATPGARGTLVFGFCEVGPYKHASCLLANPDVKWLPWSYHASKVDAPVLADLASRRSLKEANVLFASWPMGFHGKAKILRRGSVDYSSYVSGVWRATVVLEDGLPPSDEAEVHVTSPRLLCFYDPPDSAKQG